jgi:fluoride exporter
MVFALVCVCGALGAVTRFVIDAAFRARWRTTFPWPTVLINVTGSLLLGVLTGLLLHHHTGKDTVLLVGTGFCGGYTTFSTAMFETVRLIQQNAWRLVVANVVATVGLTSVAAAVGLAVAA